MKISIIIPVYNTGEYLPLCLESILSQSFTDFEVLLVDDGSRDDSGAVCDSFAAKDNRIRVLHKENGGVSSARNLGLEQAKGEWICFVDSDDRLMSGGLQALAEGISDQVDLVMASFIETTAPQEEVAFVPGEKKIVGRDEAMVSMFNTSHEKFAGYVFAKLFRRELIANKRLAFDPAISIKEDTLFVVQYLCLSSGGVFVSGTPVYYYFQRPSSAMTSLGESYNPKYLTSFEAIVQMNRLVESSFPSDKRLLSYSHDEVMNRVYRIKAHMIAHEALDKRIISRLEKRASREVGLAHYLHYQFKRNKRRATKIINRLFKTHFNVQ